MPASLVNVNALRCIGGMAVLDFLNTCNGRRPDTSVLTVTENLRSFDDVLYWFLHSELITQSELMNGLEMAHRERGHCEGALQQVLEFREMLFALLFDLTQGQPIDDARLAPLNDFLVRCAPFRALAQAGFKAVWIWRLGSSVSDLVDSLTGRLATQAATLLTSSDLSKLKCCASLACDWMFLDTSKNGQRRWCQMSVCGSKEKAVRAKAIGAAST